jgi:hypothetical protein
LAVSCSSQSFDVSGSGSSDWPNRRLGCEDQTGGEGVRKEKEKSKRNTSVQRAFGTPPPSPRQDSHGKLPSTLQGPPGPCASAARWAAAATPSFTRRATTSINTSTECSAHLFRKHQRDTATVVQRQSAAKISKNKAKQASGREENKRTKNQHENAGAFRYPFQQSLTPSTTCLRLELPSVVFRLCFLSLVSHVPQMRQREQRESREGGARCQESQRGKERQVRPKWDHSGQPQTKTRNSRQERTRRHALDLATSTNTQEMEGRGGGVGASIIRKWRLSP